jgi:hypothetical protein
MLVKARLLAESRQNLASAINDTDCQDWKFLLRLYNSLAHDQKISGVQIASLLLQFPGHYASYYKFAHVHLSRLRSHFHAFLQPGTTSHGGLEDDSCMLHARTRLLSSIIIDGVESRLRIFPSSNTVCWYRRAKCETPPLQIARMILPIQSTPLRYSDWLKPWIIFIQSVSTVLSYNFNKKREACHEVIALLLQLKTMLPKSCLRFLFRGTTYHHSLLCIARIMQCERMPTLRFGL